MVAQLQIRVSVALRDLIVSVDPEVLIRMPSGSELTSRRRSRTPGVTARIQLLPSPRQTTPSVVGPSMALTPWRDRTAAPASASARTAVRQHGVKSFGSPNGQRWYGTAFRQFALSLPSGRRLL